MSRPLDAEHALLRHIVNQDAQGMRYYCQHAIAMMKRDFEHVPDAYFTPFRAELEGADVDLMLFVVLVALATSPRFQEFIATYSSQYPLADFLKILHEQFDIFLCGLTATGAACADYSEIGYASALAFSMHLSEIIHMQ